MADTIPGNTSSAITLSINSSAASAIDYFGDTDWWRVNLVYGYQYQVWVEGYSSGMGTLFDPYLAIYNSVGAFQFATDDINYFGANYDAYATVIPNATGVYYLSAEESGNNGAGTYTITLWQDELASVSTAANIAVNSISAEGHIGWQNDTSDWYAVNLTAGVAYQFDLIGSAGDGVTTGLTLVDPWLWLRNSAGVSVASDDNDGLGLNSRVFYIPTISGTYYLDAQESGVDASGTYRLTVNASPTPGALVLGMDQVGSLDFLGDVDIFSVSLTAGVAYAFALDGTSLVDPYIEVLDSSGATSDFDDDSGAGLDAYVSYTPTATGTYYLAARESGNNATGSYSARVWQLPTISIADASVLEGNTGTTSLVFTLALSAASPVDVSVTAATSGTATATYSIDYVPSSEPVTFAAGQTSATFTVQVYGDSTFEPIESFHVLLSNPIGAELSDSDAYGFIHDNDAPYSLPADPLTGFQWHLYPTTGINVFPVWNDYTGEGVRVAVFDQGIDPNHTDLDGNLLTSFGRNASNLSAGGSPILTTDNHGTAVAGTIAAERNGSGTVGVAYGVDLVSIYNGMTVAEISNAFSYAVNFDVLNNSWGFAPQGTSYYALYGDWAFNDNFLSPSFASAGTALANLAANGRGGLGTVVVQSAGNSFALGDDTNLHNFQNSQYIITVAATDYSGNVTSYSSPGASVLVASPGGGGTDLLSDIITTDRVGTNGYGSSDYKSINGTSFSAPIVSGIVSLMLEANPDLGYRDVQEILAYSARETGSADNDWSYNGASNWNGGGLHYDALSHDLGFGLVDARVAVRLAETWTGTSNTASNRQQVTATHSIGMVIPDGGGIGAISSAFDAITVTQAIDVERVDVTLNVTHSYIGDLSVLLTSPSGTTSFLLWRPQQNPLSAYGTDQNNIHFTFDTVLDWGESSLGTWGLGIYDNAYGDIGTFDSWTLNLIGKQTSSDDTYIYTDEFAESCVDQIARSALSDTNGIDTLNAAACSSSVVLNLVAGGVSVIDGRSLTLAGGTEIENAYGGDGNDVVHGNSAANILSGTRGNDTLDGGLGADWLQGDAGTDTLILTPDGIWSSAYVGFNEGSPTTPGTGQKVSIAGKNRFSDVVDGGSDTDTLQLTDGNDAYFLHDAFSGFAAGVTLATDVRGQASAARGLSIEQILAGGGDDLIDLTSANYSIGGVIVDGGSGNDILWGNAGNDTLLGGEGNDTFFGGAGNDLLTGGAGADVFQFVGSGGGDDQISDFNTALDKLRLFGATSFTEVTSEFISGNQVLSWNGQDITLQGVAEAPNAGWVVLG